jgi:hypothetical protein
MSPLMISGWTVQWEDLPMTDVFLLWLICPELSGQRIYG